MFLDIFVENKTQYFSFMAKKKETNLFWLVVSTHFKDISQIGSVPHGSG